MKKILKFISVFALAFLLLCTNHTDYYAASASLNGPSVVRAGDTITLSLSINDNGKYGLEGKISYDSSQVTLSSASSNISGWKYENNGNSFVLYDDALTKPLSGTKTVLTLKFKVNSSIAAGTKVSISVTNIVSTDGSNESNLGTAVYSTTIAQPLSTNANLASLSVSGYTLSPAFSSGTTSYSIGEVDYSVSSLSISAKAEDSNASVKVTGNSLSVGSNKVSVVVTAENGSTKTYTISVTRKQDPNYVASNVATLSAISVSQGSISPVFSSDVTEYIVYLPYEAIGTSFTASGTASHSKAQGVTSGKIDALVEGVNKTTVTCTAEDGTKKAYTISVVVMPEYAGVVPYIEGVEIVEPEVDESPNMESTEIGTETSTEAGATDEGNDNSFEINWILALVVGLVVGAGLGALVFFFITKIRNREDSVEE